MLAAALVEQKFSPVAGCHRVWPSPALSNLISWFRGHQQNCACRSTATVKLEMKDAHGVVLTDSFSVSFHMHFAKLLKWLAAGPLVACAGAVLSMQGRSLAHVLPSFRRSSE